MKDGSSRGGWAAGATYDAEDGEVVIDVAQPSAAVRITRKLSSESVKMARTDDLRGRSLVTEPAHTAGVGCNRQGT